MELIKFDINDKTTYPEFERENYLCLTMDYHYTIVKWNGGWDTKEIIAYYADLPDFPDDMFLTLQCVSNEEV